MNQHTFPSASIARFVNQNGAVRVFHKPSQREFFAKPPDKVFCAQRLWDQQAEVGFMKRTEDAFQELAAELLDKPALRLDPQHFSTINEFYCLWNIRACNKKAGHAADMSVAGPGVIGVRRKLTKDEQELLESEGIGFIRPDLTFPSRFNVSPRILLNLEDSVQKMSSSRWRLLQADEGELLVPDNFHQIYAVPLSPSACLWAHEGFPDGRLDRQGVTAINRAAVNSSVEYYFARDLSQCPL